MSFTMYYPDQTPCTDLNEFIKCYNQLYYYDANTNVASEKFVDDLLKKTEFSEDDVFNLLAWKAGGVDITTTIDQNNIRYKKNWKKENGKYYGRGQWKELKMNSIITFVSKHSKEWLAHWNNKEFCYDAEYAQNIVSDLASITEMNESTNIGSVIIITILYFVSKGRWPIYDQYASIAMNAMKKEHMKPYERIDNIELPGKTSSAFSRMITITGRYKDYIKFIEDIELQSNYQYTNSRDIDRALWTYGHIVNDWYKIKEKTKKEIST